MCRGRTTACSRKTRASPNAAPASRIASAIAGGSSPGVSTRRMPRPPPPATALTKIGKPIPLGLRDELVDIVGCRQSRRAPGTPAAIACSLAVTLLPAIPSTVEDGPMKVMPFSAARAARSGFSDRKP